MDELIKNVVAFDTAPIIEAKQKEFHNCEWCREIYSEPFMYGTGDRAIETPTCSKECAHDHIVVKKVLDELHERATGERVTPLSEQPEIELLEIEDVLIPKLVEPNLFN